jgi:hypothetical protein
LATPNTFVVVAEKRLRFSGWTDDQTGADHTATVNHVARVNLAAMGGALAEAVCCMAPTPPVCGAPNAPQLLE